MRKFNITVNGVAYEVEVEEVGGVPAPVAVAPVAPAAPVAAPAPVAAAPAAAPAAPKATPAPKAAPVAGGTKISAPMPGTILDVKVAQGASVKKGDVVKAGQVLVILEAMKMENEIVAPKDGTVAQIVTSKGAVVDTGSPLVIIA